MENYAWLLEAVEQISNMSDSEFEDIYKKILTEIESTELEKPLDFYLVTGRE